MADNYTSQPVTSGGSTFASDDISSVHYPRVKLGVGADGASSDAIPIAAALDSTGTGIQAVGIVAQFDDAATATVTENQFAAPRISSRRALLVEGVASGTAVVTSNATTSVVGSGTEATAQRVTIATDSTGVLSVDDNGASLTIDGTVTASNTSGDVAHGTADSGNPVKIGAKGLSALPTAVDTADRANAIADLFGRLLTAHIDPAMQTWKSFNTTTAQTGADVWDPTASKKIAITSIVIGTYGTTAGRLILWFGDNADTTYSAGTDQLVLAASFAPSATSKPGLVFTPQTPVFCTTADRELHITTDADLSVDVSVYGYEWV
jgi:hypothetical protein